MSDTVAGFIALAEADLAVGKEVNIATGTEVSVGDIANILIEQINPDACVITEDERMRPDASEVFRLIGDNSLIKSLTNWSPEYDVASGLKDTIEWFKEPANLARYKSWLYNI